MRPSDPIIVGDVTASTARAPILTAAELRVGAASDGGPPYLGAPRLGVQEAVWTDIWPDPHVSPRAKSVAVGVPFVAPTVAHSCRDAGVLHWLDDHFLVETVDPATGEPVGAGEVGSVVITDLTREGSPLLRYWTGLEAALSDEPCPCGRTSVHSAFVRRLR